MDYLEMADSIRRVERARAARRRRLLVRTFLASSAAVAMAVKAAEILFF